MKFDVNVNANVHVHLDDHSTLKTVLSCLETILKNQEKMIMALDQLQAAVAAERTVVDSAIVLLTGLASQIAALKPDQAAIDSLAADVAQQTQALADAVTANTPAQP